MKLSPRIQQVCDLTLGGLTNDLIAQSLSLSVNTVKLYKKRLYRYMGVHSKQGLRNKVFGKPTPLQAKSRLDLYLAYRDQGLTYKEIARLEGVSHGSIKTYVNEFRKRTTSRAG